MRPTEILSSEHRVIEVMLDILDQMTERAHAAGRVDIVDAEQAVAFIRTFADKCHHGKEEGQLFPAMVAKGVPKEFGPIGVMLNDHEMGRQYVRLMAENIEGAANGEADALARFTEGAGAYVELLRSHIHKEDHILFPMAQRILNNEEEETLLGQFNTVEHEHIGAGVHEQQLKVAEALATKYGVATTALTGLHSGGSCACSHTAGKH